MLIALTAMLLSVSHEGVTHTVDANMMCESSAELRRCIDKPKEPEPPKTIQLEDGTVVVSEVP